MRGFDGWAKALGILLLTVVVLLTPVAAAGVRAWQWLGEPAAVVQTTTAWLTREAPGLLAKEGAAYARRQEQRTSPHEEALVFWRLLAAFDETQWRALVAYALPPKVLEPLAADAVRAGLAWLRSPQPSPRAEVSLRLWKDALQAQAVPLATWFVQQIPPCDAAGTARWVQAALLDDWSLAPLCVPVGTARRQAEYALATVFRAQVAALPNKVNLFAVVGVPQDTLLRVHGRFAMAQRQFFLGMALFGLLWLAGLLLVARTARGFFAAVALTAGPGGALTAVVGLGAKAALAYGADWLAMQVGEAAAGFAQAVLPALLAPLRMWGVAMMGVGLAAGLVALILTAIHRKREADWLSQRLNF